MKRANLLVIAVLAGLLSGCSPSTPSPDPTAAPEPAFTGQMQNLLLPPPPSTLDGKPPVAQSMSVEAAAGLHDPDDLFGASTWLEELGYERGYYTSWTEESGTIVEVALLQFVDPKGTAGWLAGTRRRLADSPDLDRQALFETVEFANWYAFKPADGYQSTFAVTWKGTIGVLVRLHVPGADQNLPMLTQLLEDQYARLP